MALVPLLECFLIREGKFIILLVVMMHQQSFELLNLMGRNENAIALIYQIVFAFIFLILCINFWKF